MSLNHLIQRLNVRREVPSIALPDEIEAIEKLERQKRSQAGIRVKKVGYQRKKELMREIYYANREMRIAKVIDYQKRNPENTKRYRANWQDKNREKTREYARNYQRKKYASMTAEQKKQASQERLKKMIEKHGLEGWRKICNERSKKSREKKKNEQCI